MKKLLSCEFNIDTACVELRYTGGEKLSIYTRGVEASRTASTPPRQYAPNWTGSYITPRASTQG